MMAVVLSAGIGLLLAGLVAIGFGIPINEFGFGNTLIVAAGCVTHESLRRRLQKLTKPLRLGSPPAPEPAGPKVLIRLFLVKPVDPRISKDLLDGL